MEVDDEFESLGRIIRAIKLFRHQTGSHQDISTDEGIATFLKHHLLASDYAFWQQLQDNLASTSLPIVDGALSLKEFEWLLGRSK